MLDSRYVHLHEALGLGAMWLQRGAKIINQSPVADNVQAALNKHQPKNQPKNQHIENKNHAIDDNMNASRLAILQRVKSQTLPPAEPVPEVVPAPKVAYVTDTLENYQQKLSGSVPKAKVMVLSVCASPADVMAGRLFSGADGLMLSKMLLAIEVDIRDVYFNSWLKDLPDFSPQPPIEMVQAATPRVQAEWQLSGAEAVLLTGKFFERDDVMAEMAKICDETRCFQIPHPQQIINNPQLKRGAWETLQQLQAHLA